ncbi:MAG: hypothetical protein EOO01_05680 [Chitinophagaceae bacterium]|nr:MAG: hypothetical protein EOO01_05680 [Chitinophagaceae bacterium]
MIKVFKTDVNDRHFANILVQQIQQAYKSCTANFDLDDCDKILRIKCAGNIHADKLIHLLKQFGVRAEVLPG